ncbi:MAG: endonuclease/exonuclease/phosphatase family protein [Clostridia bacterium]|nr:endonuclease/exonuclease/phosphatase family protein [Clostridia bacterium]MBO7503136.1 endonuclease/exonuclease/phosphatase family protein [Clostridia bacterium]
MGSRIKLMTSNVWADVFGNPVHPRDKLLAELVREEAPDVLFLQEMHPNWHAGDLKPLLKALGYAESLPALPEGQALNYTPLFYKESRLRELSNGFLLYDGLNDYTSKSVSYAEFEIIRSKIRFAAASTHMYFAQNAEGEKARMSNAVQLADISRKFPSGTPFFCGGDFNCSVNSLPFYELNSRGICCASLAAKKKTNFIRTDHKYPVYDKESHRYTPAELTLEPNCESIDHIVFRGPTDILSYKVVTDERARILSDHCPVVITAAIG